MGHKIFISYKYGDTSVGRLDRVPWYESTKVRHYVDEIQDIFEKEGQINKGELDNEDLSQFKDSTIESKLRDKIFDSSVTVVLVSPNMKDNSIGEDNQWIPWEISYSLKETTRKDKTSRINGILAVVLPDRNGGYDYMLENKTCCQPGCRHFHTDRLFNILGRNMFNKRNKEEFECRLGSKVYVDYSSYIHMIRWDEFIKNINHWIEIAERIQSNRNAYDICVNV